LPSVDQPIQKREYQELVLRILKTNYYSKPKRHTIAEVDTGLGKRVLTYLLIKEILPDQKILLLLHSTSSYSETLHYFKEEYGGFDGEYTLQGISSRTPNWLRNKILQNKETRIIAATPQTFMNAYNKLIPRPKFDVIIINEIDKIVRRQGDERLLIFPYNTLIPEFTSQGAWLIGMTGTMRDSHIWYNRRKDAIEIRDELITLDKRIPDLYVIRMDTLIEDTDIKEYIEDSISYIQMYPVKASPELTEILQLIDQAIQQLRTSIIEETQEKNPTLIESIPKDQLALVSGMLESESGQNQKYQGLLLIRKYCTAMQSKKFRKFLFRNNQASDAKTVILCSYLDTAAKIIATINESGVRTFLITGQVMQKAEILNEFKGYDGKAVLVMTSVGERDIDLPQAKLLIVYDSINTTKTMYQRMKRTRGGLVLCLYYQGTFEERKISRLLRDISSRYPWSSIIE
jgi:ERCC4-related helicase